MKDMKNNLMSVFTTIGRIQSTISKATTLDEALQGGLRIILEEHKYGYGVIWFKEETGDGNLHPYYWVCPVEISACSHPEGEGTVGRVYKSQNAERFLSFKPEDDECTEKDFQGLQIGSMVCVPLSNKTENMGCIQLLRTKEDDPFTEEEADTIEILAMMIALSIDENLNLQKPHNTGKVVLSARDIKRSFKNGDSVTQILKGVNLDVYEGEFLVILGESGCGKSTFLNILGGMDQADSGTISYMGTDLSHATQEELTDYRRKNIGFIFQSYNLMPNLNAGKNLELIAELVNNPMDIEEALDLVGLKERKNNYPSQLSGGQQQRVSIARALVKKPSLIFADEPTAALDYTTSIEILSVMEKIIAQGTTLVMVTHNEEITRMADRVVRMRDGKTYEVTVNRHPVPATDLVW